MLNDQERIAKKLKIPQERAAQILKSALKHGKQVAKKKGK